MKLAIKCTGAETANVKDLLHFQGDLKSLSDVNYQKFKRELLELGFSEPISVWVDKKKKKWILNGHQRRQTILNMISEGIEVPDLPINIVQAKDIKEAKRKVLALTSQYGEMTQDSLMDFCEIAEIDLDGAMDDFRFPEIESISLDDMDEEDFEETEGDDEVKEDVEKITKLGDLWELGEHRLLCGDSTSHECLDVLMGEELADLWLTDPPYNVNYEGKTKDALTIENDSMGNEDFREFLVNCYQCAVDKMKEGASYYIWHADSEGYNFRGACFDVGLKVRQCVIWAKSVLVMGRQDYHWKHEPCLYGWKDGKAHTWLSDRKQTTLFEFDKPTRNDIHPTMKPVDLYEYQIINSCRKGGLVLDTFLGSGTAIIACEKTNRKCYGMELDEHYCDVIVNRYANWCRDNDRIPKIKLNGKDYDKI